MSNKYDDIINLPRHISKKRSPMPVTDRAAQFAPFAALTGHASAIKETSRITEDRIELDAYMKEILDNKLQIIEEKIEDELEIEIRYFSPDEKKDGGEYITNTSKVKKIDRYRKIVLMTDNTAIPIDEILDIKGNIF